MTDIAEDKPSKHPNTSGKWPMGPYFDGMPIHASETIPTPVSLALHCFQMLPSPPLLPIVA
ncbi:hypothetical protein PAXRUDRAFT_21125 [Paxillus rubicundulus Ve08.2h10]|uniref:Unplaced genomic scaffold scaffold_5185, whole genome shotgun sequence n=1 Tax=Paxillus rubicundulus Ve08.2h10 TaxID=930991 RepID=A0A0D0D811_9AGAM|nr:hypothetical protein PAXRUDRAFT_21125 [Paxillus rubicundulus Ve08.2h10]